MKILQNFVFLRRQGLERREDGDDKSRNIYQLMLLRALDDPSLLNWINKSYDRCISPTLQNEILKLLALKLLHKIVSNTQQLVVCIRCVTKDAEVKEDFTGLAPLERAQADVIAATIEVVLMRLPVPISNPKNQCYDGCSTMFGSKKSVAIIIKQSQPNYLLIHWYCHLLNVAVGDAIKNVPVLKESLEDAYELPNVKQLCIRSKKN